MSTNVQPGATPGMSVGGGNKNAKNKLYDSNGERDWSYGLCCCLGSCRVCLGSYFCPCVIWASNKSRLEHLQRNGTPHPSGGNTSCDGDCCTHGCLCLFGCGWVLQIETRGNVRDRYRIQGSWSGDCFTAWCCTTCQLTQESRELELEERTMRNHNA